MSAGDQSDVLYVDLGPQGPDRVPRHLENAMDGTRVTVVASLPDARAAIDGGVTCVVAGVDDATDASVLSWLGSLGGDGAPIDTVLLADRVATDLVDRAYEAGVDEVVQDTGDVALRILAHHVSRSVRNGDAGSIDAPPSTYLRALMEVTNDALIAIDAESEIRYATSGVDGIFGYSPAEVVGEPLTTLMSDALAARHRESFARYLETGERALDWTDVELTGRHRDGSDVPLSVSFSEVRVGDERYFTGIVRDVTDRKRREERLARYEAMVRTVRDGIYALDDDGRFVAVNDAFCDLVDHDRSELLGRRIDEYVHARAIAEAKRLQEELAADDRQVETLETTFTTGGDDVVLVEVHRSPFLLEDDRYGRVGVVRDITDRKRREERLAQLNEVQQTLTSVETAEEVAEVVAGAARELLDLPITAVKLYDEESGTLGIAAHAGEAIPGGDDSLFASDRGIPWEVFAESEPRVYDPSRAEREASCGEPREESAIVLPLGTHGVLITGAPAPVAFGDTEVTIAKVLASNTEAALDRVDRERRLRTQKHSLEERTDTLERIERINGVIRNITRSLTHATSRSEIERAVCENLAVEGPYAFCWIAERVTVSGSAVTAKASAGDGDGYLDALDAPDDDALEGDRPPERVLQTNESQIRNALHADPPFEPWRRTAIERDFRSNIAVPLRFEDRIYGVLNVYATESGPFDDMEVEVLEELGGMIGYAINAMERKKMLVSDATVALRFELDDPDIPAIRFVRERGGEFEFDELVQQADGTFRVFFTVSGVDPETVSGFADRVASVRDLSFVAERNGRARFEATVTESGFIGRLVSYGAYPVEITATEERSQVTVELPRSGDVQAFIRMFLDTVDGAELVARRERDRPVRTREEFEAIYRERLTERQEEVLKVAYLSGFFEWPRERTGQEIAETLDVSQPTVARHIRNGERKLLDVVFDDGDDAPSPGG